MLYGIHAVKKVGHLNIKTKMFDFEAHFLTGGLARVFVSQPITTRASKLNIFVFKLRLTIIKVAKIFHGEYGSTISITTRKQHDTGNLFYIYL